MFFLSVKKSLYGLLAFLLVIGMFSVESFAGHWSDDYDGSIIDVGQIHKPSQRYPYCDRYENEGSQDPKDNNLKAYKACERGNTEARRMAERFGAGNGEVLGLMMGYVRGIWNSYEVEKNNGEYEREGAKGVTGDFRKAKAAGDRAARGEAQSLAKSDVIGNFKYAVKTGEEPVNEYDVKPLEEKIARYGGIAGGFAKSGHKVRSEEQMLKEATKGLGQTPIFHDVDATTFDNLGRITFWDLFTKRGQAKEFSSYKWNSATRAWVVWKTLPDVAKAEYDNLRESFTWEDKWIEYPDPNDPTKTIREKKKIKKVIYTKEEIQQIWADGFQGSYQFYVSHYFSLNYHKSVARGYSLGIALGAQTGKLYAMQNGKVREFNRQYQLASKDAYRSTFLGQYDEYFKSTFTDYMTHPKMEINNVVFVGAIAEDGIYTPGEELRAEIELTNLGGVGKDVSIRLVGDIEPGSHKEPEIQSVARLTNIVLQTDYLARINRQLDARAIANIGVMVDTLSRYENFEVNKIAEVDRVVISSLDVVRGTGKVRVYLSNPSKTQTPSSLKLRVEVPDLRVIRLDVPPLEGGTSSYPVDVSFEGLDPLQLIDKGQFSVSVSVAMGEDELHSGRASTYIEKLPSLARYFHLLTNKQFEDMAQSDYEIRVGEVQSRVVAAAQDVVGRKGGSDIWNSNPLSTMTGQLANQFKTNSFSSNPTVAANARAQYQALGQTLWPLRDKCDKGSARKSYSLTVMEFAPGIEKKKLKK